VKLVGATRFPDGIYLLFDDYYDEAGVRDLDLALITQIEVP
jgi:hypothetical protein